MYKNGILDEQFPSPKKACKQNIHCEIMLVKHALQPYQQILKHIVIGMLNNIKHVRSKEFMTCLNYKLLL